MRAVGKRFAVIGPILVAWSFLSVAGGSAAEPSTPSPPAEAPTPQGNPLWARPIEDLTATRERPIFSPSRRPPEPVAIAPQPPPPPPAPSAPAHPPLELIGTILNGSDSYGIFREQDSDTVISMRTGEIHEGWSLRAISTRTAMLQKDQSNVMLALPAPDSDAIGNGGGSGNQPLAAAPAATAPKPSQQQSAPIFYPEH